MSQQTRNELNELVDRYIALWHETDAELRRKKIAELWIEDGVQFTASREIRGYTALEKRVESAHEEFVKTGGFIFRPSSSVSGHHDALMFKWEMVPAGDGEVAAVGTIFLLLSDDGRIRLDYQF